MGFSKGTGHIHCPMSFNAIFLLQVLFFDLINLCAQDGFRSIINTSCLPYTNVHLYTPHYQRIHAYIYIPHIYTPWVYIRVCFKRNCIPMNIQENVISLDLGRPYRNYYKVPNKRHVSSTYNYQLDTDAFVNPTPSPTYHPTSIKLNVR